MTIKLAERIQLNNDIIGEINPRKSATNTQKLDAIVRRLQTNSEAIQEYLDQRSASESYTPDELIASARLLIQAQEIENDLEQIEPFSDELNSDLSHSKSGETEKKDSEEKKLTKTADFSVEDTEPGLT
jgi:hypothetical protein